jgi:hypothetical protein
MTKMAPVEGEFWIVEIDNGTDDPDFRGRGE